MSVISPKGNRKFHLALLTLVIVAAIYIVTLAMKGSTEMFLGFAGQAVAICVTFMAGNAAEHKYANGIQQPPPPAP